MKFIIYENILISFISYANQICDTGITIFREILSYLFIEFINPYYNFTIINILVDTLESLKISDKILKAVKRYFELKKSFKLLS
jgi:uncharacterized membrane-anchored protein YitT (DUF2179 family)